MSDGESQVLRATVELLSSTLKDVLAAKTQPAGPDPSQYFAAFEKGLEIGAKIGQAQATPAPAPAPTPEHQAPIAGPAWLGLADRVVGLLDRVTTQRQAPAGSSQAAGIPAQRSERHLMSLPAWMPRVIAEGLPRLIDQAKQGSDPELVASYIARELLTAGDPETIAAMRELLARPGFPVSIVNDVPALEPYRAWFTRFLFALQQSDLGKYAAAVSPPAPAPAPAESGRPGNGGRRRRGGAK